MIIKSNKTINFVNKAKLTHNNKYSYDKTVYLTSIKKIIITCPIHGNFEQTPSAHLQGQGCKKCGILSRTIKKTNNLEKFVNKANKIHNNKYSYDKCIYKHTKINVIITCPIHGDFEQTPNNHLSGKGCKKCAINKQSNNKKFFVDKANKIHNNKYSYDKTVYLTSKNKILITCPIHGDFEQRASAHLRGQGCLKCSNIKKTTEQFINEANKIHNNKYSYDKTVYNLAVNRILIVCPIHGDFEQQAANHLNGQGCPKCADLIRIQKTKITNEQFIERAKQIHKNKYSYDKTVYIHSESKVIIFCSTHGDFEQQPYRHLQGHGCPKCVHQISKSEQEIVDYIKSVYSGTVEQSNRNILSGKELDIYLPEINVAIEFNGLYWHNENNKANNYHVQKTNDCEKQNIHLVQIFENEWLHKQEIVKSRLKQILGVNKDKRIYGRQCIIRELDAPTERIFMNNNHLQGYVTSKVCYGLIYVGSNGKEYLVAAMSFGSLRKNLGSSNVDGCYELYRFCNIKNHSVVGGANKLFKHFLKTFKPKKIISFANRRYSFINKNIYQNLGFTFESTTPPSYYYIQGTKLINRFALRKDVLVREYGCPENMSEREFCNEQGWFRIYDAGNLRYVYIT